MLWRDANGHEMLGAKVENGKATQLSLNTIAPIMVLLPVPWYLNSAWLLPLLYASMAVLALTVILWPTRAIVRRRFGATLRARGQRPAGCTAGAGSRPCAILGRAHRLVGRRHDDVRGRQLRQRARRDHHRCSGVLSLIAFVGGFLVMLWYAYTVWRGKWRWPAKVWSIVLVIAAATVLHVAIAYKLIGFTTNY